MSRPVSAMMARARSGLRPGISGQPGHRGEHRSVRAGAGVRAGSPVGIDAPGGGHGRSQLSGPGRELGDPRVKEGDLVQQQLGELAVVVIEQAGQGLDQVVVLGLHPAAGQAGQHLRVTWPAIMALIMSWAETVVSVLATAETLISASLN